MSHAKQNLPRALATPARVQNTGRRAIVLRWKLLSRLASIVVLAVVGVVTAVVLLGGASSQAVSERRVDHEVSTLLAGLPQRVGTLGVPSAPVTVQLYADLKDPTSREWFLEDFPAIVQHDVRTGAIRIEFRAYKTNTYFPEEFVKEQTAALAAGAQNKLWNFVDTFYHEQGSETKTYVTESYVDGIARQVPGLNLTEWHAARHTGRREEQATAEDQAAKALGLHVTPAFRIGPTGGAMKSLSGHEIIQYSGQANPVAMVSAQDIGEVIEQLTREGRADRGADAHH
jgi:protein-disulfide isomerase